MLLCIFIETMYHVFDLILACVRQSRVSQLELKAVVF